MFKEIISWFQSHRFWAYLIPQIQGINTYFDDISVNESNQKFFEIYIKKKMKWMKILYFD